MYPTRQVVDAVIAYLEANRSGRPIDIAWSLMQRRIYVSEVEVRTILNDHPRVRLNARTQRYELKPT